MREVPQPCLLNILLHFKLESIFRVTSLKSGVRRRSNSKQGSPSGKLWWTFLQKGSYTLGPVLRLEASHLRFSLKTQHRFEFSSLAYVNSLLCCSQCNRWRVAQALGELASFCLQLRGLHNVVDYS